MTTPTYADLRLNLERIDTVTHSYRVHLTFRLDTSAADEDISTRSRIPTVLNLTALRETILSQEEYGGLLTAALFADEEVRSTFNRVRAIAKSHLIPLRFRLALDPEDAVLHQLRWEWLQEYVNGPLLTLSEQVLFSRYLPGGDGRPVYRDVQGITNVLVIVASPSDLDSFGLKPLKVRSEINRMKRALGGKQPRILASGRPRAAEHPTLPNFLQAIDRGAETVIIIAHGTLDGTTPYLWLEQPDGRADKVDARTLVDRVAEAQRRPHLVILASCDSAGRENDDDALAALGPRLVAAGVPAVIAMQGRVSITTIGTLLPTLLEQLYADGCIDRALAAGRRAAEREHADWWRPTLTMRIRDGQLWITPPGATVPSQRKTITRNPFGRRGRIEDPREFYGREGLLRRIFEELDKGSNLSLIGDREIGKSSLLSKIQREASVRLNNPPTGAIYIDMHLIHSEEEFFEALCGELEVELHRGYRLSRSLKNKHYILCLDEIEKMNHESFSADVRDELRGLADGASSPLTLVIASSIPLDSLFPDKLGQVSPLAGICSPMSVEPFTWDEANVFLKARLENTGVTFSANEITDLLEQSQRHPGRLQQLAAKLYDRYATDHF